MRCSGFYISWIKSIISIGVILVSFSTFGQAALDAFNSFDNSVVPVGWTMSLNVSPGSYYYAAGSDATQSARLDATGEFITVAFAEKAALVSYFIRSTGIGEAVAPGTEFTVQQSTNGSVWTDLRVLNESNLSGNFVQFTDNLAANTRFVRFYYTNKSSGSNMALDEIFVQKAAAGPEASLMIYRDGEKVLAGSQLEFSGEESVLLEFVNEGLSENLAIASVNWSGLDASEFSFSVTPDLIPAQSSVFLEVQFSGESGQVYEAMFAVSSNDAYNPDYLVNCLAYGGSFAPEPLASMQNFIAAEVTTWQFNLSWIASMPMSDGVLVLQSADVPVAAIPEDGVAYERGNYIGDDKVVYVGNNNAFIPRTIGAARTYHYAIYAYNGQGNYRNYKQSNPLLGQVTTPNNLIGNYYSGISAQVSTFSEDLTNKLFPHTQLSYDDYDITLINDFEARDTLNNQLGVTCYYTGYEYIYEDQFAWDVLSREHVFAHSWFASYPAFEGVEYSDYHNLFPVHNDSANLVRSNHPLGVVQNPIQTFLEGQLGYNVLGNLVYEPRDEAKGRAARAMFYMLSTYNQQVAGPWQLLAEQDQQLLKTWHFQNPPNRREIARNDFIYSIQGNRNAYVDSIHYACYIDFYTMNYIDNPPGWCVALSNSEVERDFLSVFPNPTSGLVNLHMNVPLSDLVIELFDISGKRIWQKQMRSNVQNDQIDLSGLDSGYYYLQWISSGNKGYKQIVLCKP
jgi:hypothetical protein